MPSPQPMGSGKLTMESRKKLTLTGATEVLRFDEDLAELNTDLGTLLIEGTGLKLKCLSLDTGTVVVEGELQALRYADSQQKRRLWR